MKFKPILILFFLLFCMSIQMLAQEKVATATIEQLEKEMYRLFPTQNADEFTDVTERLKEASLKAGNEGLFYRAWANQAFFIFSKINRQKGMEIAKAMNEYSKQHDSKLGIYYSSIANAHQSSSLKMEDEALKLYLNAIQYKQKYLPNINAAPAYIGAAKVYYNRRNKEKVLEMTDKALAEPNLIGSNIVDAWSYRCMASMIPEGMDHKEELNRNYEEWKKAKEKYKYNSAFSSLIEVYHAQVNNDYDKMLELAKDIKSPQERYKMMSHAYEYLGKTQANQRFSQLCRDTQADIGTLTSARCYPCREPDKRVTVAQPIAETGSCPRRTGAAPIKGRGTQPYIEESRNRTESCLH